MEWSEETIFHILKDMQVYDRKKEKMNVPNRSVYYGWIINMNHKSAAGLGLPKAVIDYLYGVFARMYK